MSRRLVLLATVSAVLMGGLAVADPGCFGPSCRMSPQSLMPDLQDPPRLVLDAKSMDATGNLVDVTPPPLADAKPEPEDKASPVADAGRGTGPEPTSEAKAASDPSSDVGPVRKAEPHAEPVVTAAPASAAEPETKPADEPTVNPEPDTVETTVAAPLLKPDAKPDTKPDTKPDATLADRESPAVVTTNPLALPPPAVAAQPQDLSKRRPEPLTAEPAPSAKRDRVVMPEPQPPTSEARIAEARERIRQIRKLQSMPQHKPEQVELAPPQPVSPAPAPQIAKPRQAPQPVRAAQTPKNLQAPKPVQTPKLVQVPETVQPPEPVEASPVPPRAPLVAPSLADAEPVRSAPRGQAPAVREPARRTQSLRIVSRGLTPADYAGRSAARAQAEVPVQGPIAAPTQVQAQGTIVVVAHPDAFDSRARRCEIGRDGRPGRCTPTGYYPYGEAGYRPYGGARGYAPSPAYIQTAPDPRIISIVTAD